MRLSLRWVGVLTAAALVVLALWPENRALRGPQRVLAQDKSNVGESIGPGRKARQEAESSHGEGDEAAAAVKQRRSADVFRRIHEHPLSSDAGRAARIESALDEAVNFKIEPQSFHEALDLLAGKFHIPILIDQKALDDANVDTSQEVKLNAPGVTLRETIELLLSIPASPLGIEIRHGTLMVSTIDQINEHMQVVVYDCRDLAHLRTLDHFPVEKSEGGAGSGGGGMGGGMFQAPQDAAKPPVAAQGGRQKPAAGVPGQAPPPANVPVPAPVGPAPVAVPAPVPGNAPRIEDSRRLPLIQTIKAATAAESWDEGASISELEGLLIVRQNPRVHEQIKALLADIRRMRDNGAFASFAKEYEAEAKRRAESEAAQSQQAGKAADRPSPASARHELHPPAGLGAPFK